VQKQASDTCFWGGGGGGGEQCTFAIIIPEWLPPCIASNSTSSWETRRSEEVRFVQETILSPD